MQNVLKKTAPTPEVKVQIQKVEIIPPVNEKKRPQAALFSKYSHYLPLLIFACICYAVTGFILFAVSPRQIQNVLLTNGYLPLLLCTGLGHFFFFSYLFLNIRRGFFMTLILTAALFLLLQQVFTWPAFAIIVIPLLCIELVLTLMAVRRYSGTAHATFRQKTRHR